VDAGALNSLTEPNSDCVEATEIQKKVRHVFESLTSSRDREVIKRFYLDEVDKRVICHELGLTPLQFTQVMSRARQRMKLIFESQGIRRGDFFSVVATVGLALFQANSVIQSTTRATPNVGQETQTNVRMPSDQK
jgi:hypothetical protein